MTLRIGTRGSPLALAQAHEVRDLLRRNWPPLREPDAMEIVVLKTTGDRVQDRPLSELGGKGLFTRELDDALCDGRIHCAVHSMKDVPARLPPGMVLPALLERQDVRDAFISSQAGDFGDLPDGALVGTTSLRRQAQILARHPGLKVTLFRGNVQTRLRKLADGEAHATVLAMAGLNRLNMAHVATRIMEPEQMLPAAGQGAIGITCLENDAPTRAFLAPLNHAHTALCVQAERTMLDILDGSCRTPIAACANLSNDGANDGANGGADGEATIRIRGMVAEADGTCSWTAERCGPVAAADPMARELGAELRAKAGEAFFARLADQPDQASHINHTKPHRPHRPGNPMTIMLTRPDEDSATLAARLEAHGIATFTEPMLEIEYYPEPEPDLSGAQGLLITSANGIRAFAAVSARRDIPVWTVGPGSAEAARTLGFAQVTHAAGDSAALAALVHSSLKPSNGALVHVAGSHLAGHLGRELTAKGHDYRRTVLYKAHQRTLFSEAARRDIRSSTIRGLVMYSPRTAATVIEAMGIAGLKPWSHTITAFCLSEAVAAEARSIKWQNIAVAQTPDEDSLVSRVLQTVSTG